MSCFWCQPRTGYDQTLKKASVRILELNKILEYKSNSGPTKKWEDELIDLLNEFGVDLAKEYLGD